MSDWYFLLAPVVVVLTVLLLFRFVGCTSFGTADDMSYTVKPTGEPDYPATILGEPDLVSYWRLQEPSTTVAGDTAEDKKGVNNGKYKAGPIPTNSLHPESPAGPDGTPHLGVTPGLLELGQQSTSLRVNGAYVEVPFSPSLALSSFTIEALVFPEWDKNDPQESTGSGFYRAVIGLTGDGPAPYAFGFAIYAGPEDPANNNYTPTWQVSMGDGTTSVRVKSATSAMALVDFQHTTYLGLTFDGTKLNLFVVVRGIDFDDPKVHPLKDATVAYSPNTNPANSLVIGADRNPGGGLPLYPFHGRIQEVAVYRKALTIGRCPASHVCAALVL